jgi:transcriptional antiterminator Rof (Rho-off)
VHCVAYIGALIPDIREKNCFYHLQIEITLKSGVCSSQTLVSRKTQLHILEDHKRWCFPSHSAQRDKKK